MPYHLCLRGSFDHAAPAYWRFECSSLTTGGQQEPRKMKDLLTKDLPPDDIYFGQTAAMQVIRQKLQKVANTDIPLLIVGEHGTGKEVLARWVHAQSIWGQGSFLKLIC